jgi:hypothetical protein
MEPRVLESRNIVDMDPGVPGPLWNCGTKDGNPTSRRQASAFENAGSAAAVCPTGLVTRARPCPAANGRRGNAVSTISCQTPSEQVVPAQLGQPEIR